MLFTITSAGLAAVNAAQTGGPKITITTYKLGSAVNYTPSIADTALRGATLYTSNLIEYAVESYNTVTYRIICDASVGDFAFGEVGLYLDNGTLFALASISTLQSKVKSTTAKVGNVVEILAKLNLTNIAPAINFPTQLITAGKLQEMASVDLLSVPANSQFNTYLIPSGDVVGGGSTIAARKDDFFWAFDSHSIPVLNGIACTSATTQSITNAASNPLVADVLVHKYILVITSGTYKGYSRYVTSSIGGVLTWQGALPGVPAVGTTYDVYVSNYSYLKTNENQFISATQYGLNTANPGGTNVTALTNAWFASNPRPVYVPAGTYNINANVNTGVYFSFGDVTFVGGVVAGLNSIATAENSLILRNKTLESPIINNATLTVKTVMQTNRIDEDMIIPDGMNGMTFGPFEVGPNVSVIGLGNSTWSGL